MIPKLIQEHTLYDSDEELQFSYWLDELKDRSYIIEWYRDVEPFLLTHGLTHDYFHTEYLKTKTKTTKKSQYLLRPSEYTPDFKIVWSDTADNILFQTLQHNSKIIAPFIADVFEGCPISIVEIKPDFDRNNMTRLFKLNQKFVWDKFKQYINMIKVSELFTDTFTPSAHLLTKTGKHRKIKWDVVSVDNFLKKSL